MFKSMISSKGGVFDFLINYLNYLHWVVVILCITEIELPKFKSIIRYLNNHLRSHSEYTNLKIIYIKNKSNLISSVWIIIMSAGGYTRCFLKVSSFPSTVLILRMSLTSYSIISAIVSFIVACVSVVTTIMISRSIWPELKHLFHALKRQKPLRPFIKRHLFLIR